MRTLRNIIRSLTSRPLGFSADGRPLGLGLDVALQAQRARGADERRVDAPARAVSTHDRPYTAA
jgi:hypothetical protein